MTESAQGYQLKLFSNRVNNTLSYEERAAVATSLYGFSDLFFAVSAEEEDQEHLDMDRAGVPRQRSRCSPLELELIDSL